MKAKKLMREMMVFWKKNEKEERDVRKREQKEALDRAKVEEEKREAARQARKLEFLISQTELYSHFVGNKLKSKLKLPPLSLWMRLTISQRPKLKEKMLPPVHQPVLIWRMSMLERCKISILTMVGHYFPYDIYVELTMGQMTKPTYTGTLGTMHKKLSLLPNSARRISTHRRLLNERQMRHSDLPRDRLTSVMKTSKPMVPLWLIVRAVPFYVM